jgi:hypothetical protein
MVAGIAGAQTQSFVNCATGVACNSLTGPINTKTGDPAWTAFGKLNADLSTLWPLLTVPQFSTIPNNTVLGNTSGAAALPSALSTISVTGITVGNGGSISATGTGTITATSITGANSLTAFTASGCSYSTLTGGYAALGAGLFVGAGSFTAGASGTCTVTLTFATALHFWNCSASNFTSQIPFVQTGRSATTCQISAAASSGDVVTVLAVGY